eukprot:6755032-Pyramimonas_sp.AAC.1
MSERSGTTITPTAPPLHPLYTPSTPPLSPLSGSEAYGRQDLTDKSPLHPSCIVQHTLKRPL